MKTDILLGLETNSFVKVSNENSVQKLKGITSVIHFMNLFTQFGLNITYDTSCTKFGEYVNGTYTDFLGKLQREEIDMVAHAMPYVVNKDAFNFNPPGGEYKHVIVSLTKPVENSTLNVFESVTGIDNQTWLLTIMTLIMLTRFSDFNIINLIAMFFQQYFNPRAMIKFLVLTVVSFQVILFTLITANFCTDLSVSVTPAKIETLKDVRKFLRDSSAMPLFLEMSLTHQVFKYSNTIIGREIWKSVQKRGVNKCVLTVAKVSSILDQLSPAMKGQRILLLPDMYVSCLTPLICFMFRNDANALFTRKQSFYTSRSFARNLIALPIRKSLENEKRIAVTKVAHRILSQGFITYMEKYTFKDSVSEGISNSDISCESRIFDPVKIATEMYKDIAFSMFWGPMVLTTCLMVFAVFLLINEIRENRQTLCKRRRVRIKRSGDTQLQNHSSFVKATFSNFHRNSTRETH